MLIKKSVEFKIDLNAKDQSGNTGFHVAIKNGHMKIVEMLKGLKIHRQIIHFERKLETMLER